MSRNHNPSHRLAVIVSVLVIGALTLLLVGCSSTPSTGAANGGGTSVTGPLKVVAAENFWGNITSQIGGTSIRVTSILSDPSADPHLYTSNAQNAAAVAQADVVVVNGAGYDAFMDKLLQATPNPARVVVSVDQVLGATGGGVNPHLWYDLPRLPEVTAAIEQALAAKDPSHAKEFAANRATFDASLKPILAAIATIRQKYAGAPVAYTERVTGYLLAAAGLEVKTPAGFAAAVEEGNEPSPADAATMKALMQRHQVKLLLYNAQATSPTTQTVQDLAKAAGVPVIAVTETLPPEYATYQAWQLAQVQAILAALGG
jgi:zinc/manganese transport system substrate-binding protein